MFTKRFLTMLSTQDQSLVVQSRLNDLQNALSTAVSTTDRRKLKRSIRYLETKAVEHGLLEDVTHKALWWQCSKGHEWEATLDERTRFGQSCPVCEEENKSKTHGLAAEGANRQ